MNHELAYSIFSERSVQYLERLRTEEIERVKKSSVINMFNLMILVGFCFVQYWALSNISYQSSVDEFIAKTLVFLLILAATVFVGWLLLAPFERSLRKKLELIDRFETEVLYRAMNEAYDESTGANKK